MTNPDKTHISIIIDRSGSMSSVSRQAAQAVNHFITEQKEQPGECTLLLADFDGDDPFRIAHDGRLADAPLYRLDARGNTPLLDAVGRMITQTGDRLDVMTEDDKPSKVIVVVQTDGQENASCEYTWEKVRDLIKHQTDVYNWQFIFLGMGLDTFKQGSALGIQNVVRADANNPVSNQHSHSVMSAYTSQYRGGHSHDMSAMAGVHVNSIGQVFNAAGEEVDPDTGKVIGKVDEAFTA